MTKVFRLYNGGSNTIIGWQGNNLFPYDSKNRATIIDPNGASALHEITSIPSPFARIELVKTAFGEVCKSKNLDGAGIFHKMVSDTLDVGEIFFNISKYADQIEIIPCNIKTMINTLSNDNVPAHKCLADALDKYYASDEGTYNFGVFGNDIYLLNYIGMDRKGAMDIIGATSPATLFFSTSNDLSHVSEHIFFKNQDQPFDQYYQPLYKRDFEYVKTWYILRKSINNFSNLCPEVDAYLGLTFSQLGNAEKNVIANIDGNAAASYLPINTQFGQTRSVVTVLGQNILSGKPFDNNGNACQFTIKPSKTVNGQLPLVLPVESGNTYCNLIYTSGGTWGKNSKALYEDKQDDLSKRKLPYDGSIYPYITISDLLEDTLINVPHTLNDSNYFSGNINTPGSSYLIPLKPLIFKYFSADDLISGTVNGQDKFIEMYDLNGSAVKVTLRVPIIGNQNVSYIEYVRKYYTGNSANIAKNDGGIREFDFTGLIMPIVKFNNPKDAYYTVACVSGFLKKYKLEFFEGETQLPKTNMDCRNDDGEFRFKSENYTIEGYNFDYIRISDPRGYCGLILPRFKRQGNIVSYTFAVDLGTSNTHIEYKTDDDTDSRSFDYKEGDALACLFHTPKYDDDGIQDDLIDETLLVIKDFLPNKLGVGDFLFPTRTALSFKKQIVWTNRNEPYVLYNLPFTYDKRTDIDYNKVENNIKWSNEDSQHELKACIECIMLMLRDKVLLNGGDLASTKITWFYPISMEQWRREEFESTWKKCFKKYFSSQNGQLSMMTESEAPIHYYSRLYGNAKHLINIDIGGGTTDIAFADDDEIKYVTSFRYATNALFEDPFSGLNMKNGIIDFYRKYYEELLKEKKGVDELRRIAGGKNNKLPSNMACFLFSLKGNSIIKDAKIEESTIDFNELLRKDKNFKIVFIIYYTAIIYHVAQIVKTKGMTEPRHISFSGNGSKIVQVLTPNEKQLAKFTMAIFELVLGREYKGKLDIIGLDDNTNPKEATCKGGIVGKISDLDDDNIIMLKGDNSGLIEKKTVYKNITDEEKKSIIKSVCDFFEFTLEKLNKEYDFCKNFNVTKESINIAKEVYKDDIETWLDKGIAERMKEAPDSQIEETTFFYPIKGAINTISNAIYESLTPKEQ